MAPLTRQARSSSSYARSFLRRCRVRYIAAPHRGPSATRNTGIKQAAAPIILFMDDDCEADRTLVATHAARDDRARHCHYRARGLAPGTHRNSVHGFGDARRPVQLWGYFQSGCCAILLLLYL